MKIKKRKNFFNKLYLNKKYNFLKPVKHSNLIRVGNQGDGGYVVDKKILKESNVLISFGVGDDWSFEKKCLNLNKKIKIFIYDNSIDFKVFFNKFTKYLRRFITFRSNLQSVIETIKILKNYLQFREFINNNEVKFSPNKISNKVKNKEDIIFDDTIKNSNTNDKIILKCDIEGDEYKIINQISNNSNAIEMIVIEFHWVERNFNIFKNSIKKLKKNYEIIHFHANNNSPFLPKKLPAFVEITLLKKNKIKIKKYVKKLPNNKLDFPNNNKLKDIKIFFSN